LGKKNLKTFAVIGLVIVAIALTSTTYAALNTSRNIDSVGAVNVSAELGAYSDSQCVNEVSSIDWGPLNPGGSNNQTIYIKNTGSGVSLSLNMTTSSWEPSNAKDYITIIWDQEGTRLMPGQSVAANITVVVSPSIVDITSFNDLITIMGIQ
jgi:archaellum component FlaG (FlaF/FlaG flagellin family)